MNTKEFSDEIEIIKNNVLAFIIDGYDLQIFWVGMDTKYTEKDQSIIVKTEFKKVIK